jgi:uncharacterized protein with ParB-like and HNH nuclease domain
MNVDLNKQEFQLLSLKKVFENRYFVIPDYQRGYSWEEDHQVKDLIKDIEHLFGKNYTHFTGTIVAAKSKESQNTFEIVDGQQRLTTLVILLKQLYDLDPLSNKDLFDLYIQRGDHGNERLVLTSNEETRLCFQSEIVFNTHYNTEIKSHECMVAAKTALKNWVKKNIERTAEIRAIVTERLGFIFFSPINDKEIGIMFEVINNRGKALSELEKIKNYFIYYATVFGYETLRTTINDNWKTLQRNLSQAKKTSNDDENTFLRSCYIVFFDYKKSKNWYVYDELKLRFSIEENDSDKLKSDLSAMTSFIYFIKEASLHYAYFYNENFFQTNYSHEESKSEIHARLAYLRCRPVYAPIMPLYLSIMARLDEHEKVIT